MAISATAVWEVRTTGSDLNGGAFDNGVTANITSLIAQLSTGNTATPTVATLNGTTPYSFAATDINNWLYVKTGTNWTVGWYKILSIGGGTATIGTAGTGYTTGDVVEVSGGTSTSKLRFTVTAAGGAVTAVAVQQAGAYTVLPANNVATTVITGGGSGTLTLTVVWGCNVDASIGNVIITNWDSIRNTVAGIATVASPTSGSCMIDYSQNDSPILSLTDCTTSASTTLSSTAGPFTRAMVGSAVLLTGGNSASTIPIVPVRRVITAWTSATSVTLDASTGLTAQSNVSCKVSGALLTLGAFGKFAVSGNDCYVKTGTYVMGYSGAATAVVVAAGTGYAVGDIVNVTGGTGIQSAQFYVATVSAGTVLTVTLYNAGQYTATPANNAATTHATGSGDNALTLTVTYTAAVSNFPGGRLTAVSASATTNCARLVGYNSTRGALITSTGSGKPVLQAVQSLGASVAIVTGAAGLTAENIVFDANSQTTTLGLNSSSNMMVKHCKAMNATTGFAMSAGGFMIGCEATTCSTAGFTASSSSAPTYLIGCVAHDNTSTGFNISGAGICYSCIADTNTGGTSNGFASSGSSAASCFVNCIAYANGQHGFTSTGSPNTTLDQFINCVAVTNTGTGFQATGVRDSVVLQNCVVYNNGTNITAGDFNNQRNVTTLTGDPFTNSAGQDFSLNNTAGAGAVLRNGGYLGAFIGTVSTGYQDIGAVQYLSSGGVKVHPGMSGGFVA